MGCTGTLIQYDNSFNLDFLCNRWMSRMTGIFLLYTSGILRRILSANLDMISDMISERNLEIISEFMSEFISEVPPRTSFQGDHP